MVIRFLILVISLFLTVKAEATKVVAPVPFDIDLWKNGLPNTNGVEPQGYDDKKKNFKPSMRVYLPAKTDKPVKAVIICPGGGYSSLAMEHEGYGWASFFNNQEIAAIVLKYRLPNGYPEVPSSDVIEAIRLTKAFAAEWNIDSTCIGIMGSSAGGHLASTVATRAPEEFRPAFQILFYPVILMDSKSTHAGSRSKLLGDNPPLELERLYSNNIQVTNKTPPAFIALSDDDSAVNPINSIKYYMALKEHGVSAAMYIYPTGGHGWGIKPNFRYNREMLNELRKWLSTLTGTQEQPIISDFEKISGTQWDGKRVVYLGDSMTDPRSSATTHWYWQYLKELLNINYSVYAKSGYQWDGIYRMAEKMCAEEGDSIDAIFIWAGTNDYNHNIPIGKFFTEEMRQINHNGIFENRKCRIPILSDSTFCGRINKVLSFLKEQYPTKQIILLTPIHRGFARFSEKNIQPAENFANGQGLYLDMYIDALKKAGIYWAVPVVDLHSLSGLYPISDAFVRYFNNSETDRLHPNASGHYRIAKTIQYQLITLPCSL